MGSNPHKSYLLDIPTILFGSHLGHWISIVKRRMLKKITFAKNLIEIELKFHLAEYS